MRNNAITLVEEKQMQSMATYKVKEKDKDGKETEKIMERKLEKFDIGDQVDIHQRILEGGKERIQVFSGTVIAKRGSGMRETFTVRRIVQGEGVERIFPLYSPRIARLEVKRTGKVRRAKLYYLRDRVGKATRLREKAGKAEKVSIPGTPEAPAST